MCVSHVEKTYHLDTATWLGATAPASSVQKIVSPRMMLMHSSRHLTSLHLSHTRKPHRSHGGCFILYVEPKCLSESIPLRSGHSAGCYKKCPVRKRAHADQQKAARRAESVLQSRWTTGRSVGDRELPHPTACATPTSCARITGTDMGKPFRVTKKNAARELAWRRPTSRRGSNGLGFACEATTLRDKGGALDAQGDQGRRGCCSGAVGVVASLSGVVPTDHPQARTDARHEWSR